MNDKQNQIEEIKKQIEILKQEVQNKQAVLNGLLNMLNVDED